MNSFMKTLSPSLFFLLSEPNELKSISREGYYNIGKRLQISQFSNYLSLTTMRFLSITPTIFLAAVTFCGTSQQAPVDGLEPRELSPEVTNIVSGFVAIDFSVQSTLLAENGNSVSSYAPFIYL